MDTRANYAIIGIFTIAVIAAAFGFVFWFSGSDSGKQRSAYRVEFEGSVAGLAKGAGVLFNGIRVGDVTNVFFDAKRPKQAFATIEVDTATPVREDTRASLDVAILSGAAVIALTGGDPAAPPLQPRAGETVPTIEADRGGLSSLLETARGTAERANDILATLQGIVNDNRPAINNSIKNVESFTDALGRNAPGLSRLTGALSTAAERIVPLTGKLETLTDDTDALIRSVDRGKVASIVGNVDNVLQTVSNSRQQLANIVQDTSTLMRRLNDVAPVLQQTLADAGRVVGAIDPVRLNGIVDNASRFTGALGNASRDVEATARNANSLTAKLDAAAGRVDGVLKAAENFLGSAAGQEGQSTFASIRAAADSVRKTADALDRRFSEISIAVTRISTSGTRQLEGVGTDARRAINTIGRAAKNLETNPQSIIFGGRPSLPEYGGR